jgi:hypothetical protein
MCSMDFISVFIVVNTLIIFALLVKIVVNRCHGKDDLDGIIDFKFRRKGRK